MQILCISVYSLDGRRRDVRFSPGKLNILTGASRTGKSALLDIIEYCMGRDTVMMSAGVITSSVSWYAALLLMPDGTKAFVARPAAAPGRASTQMAMLEIGASIDLLDHSQLMVNTDTRALRQELGRRIGIDDNLVEPPLGSLRLSFAANLGHGVLLCLQGQNEIADRAHLFHRQSDQNIAQGIKDTLPYFLGAVPPDQAMLRAQLREAKRSLARLTAQLKVAEQTQATATDQLASVFSEAQAVGLVDRAAEGDAVSVRSALESTLHGGTVSVADVDEGGSVLRRESDDLIDSLKAINAERRLLLEVREDEGDYRRAVGTQVARLRSIHLIGDPLNAADSCPLCGSHMAEADASVGDLRSSLTQLEMQLEGAVGGTPRRSKAIEDLDQVAESLRARLVALDEAEEHLAEGTKAVQARGTTGQQDFVRGRISAILSSLRGVDASEMERLQREYRSAETAVESLERALDSADETIRLDSALARISHHMSELAEHLDLEHGSDVRLDANKLTVIVETDEGPVPLWRIGSAENWIGLHLISHLALHKYFVENTRPVPRFLVLDQPTQAYYPSELEQERGIPGTDKDVEAVKRMFKLMQNFVASLSPHFQIIVCDHANLADQWFSDAVQDNWRNGVALIPADWIEAS